MDELNPKEESLLPKLVELTHLDEDEFAALLSNVQLPPGQAADVNDHLERCGTCRDDLAVLREVIADKPEQNEKS